VPRALALQVLFGRGPGFFLLVWTLVGLVMTTGAFLSSEPLHGPSYDRTATGFVRHVEKASSDDDNHTYIVTAEFNDDEGHAHSVRSFVDGTRREGSIVDVRYERHQPEHAVIAGGRTHAGGPAMPFFLIGIMGLGFVVTFRRTANQRLALRLLPHGVVTAGTVVEHDVHDDGENATWTTRFEFTTLDKRTSSCESKTQSDPSYAVGQSHPIIYDPGWPDRATPLAHLDCAPAIDSDDRVTFDGSSVRLALIVAMLAACAVFAVLLPFAFARWW
jgi:hypothetical protein